MQIRKVLQTLLKVYTGETYYILSAASLKKKKTRGESFFIIGTKAATGKIDANRKLNLVNPTMRRGIPARRMNKHN